MIEQEQAKQAKEFFQAEAMAAQARLYKFKGECKESELVFLWGDTLFALAATKGITAEILEKLRTGTVQETFNSQLKELVQEARGRFVGMSATGGLLRNCYIAQRAQYVDWLARLLNARTRLAFCSTWPYCPSCCTDCDAAQRKI
jgi:hypothetical protein